MTTTEIMAGLLLGVGLSAACGFRVFVPLLAVSVAGLTGWLPLGDSFRWLATWPALTVLGVATVAEVLAYHIPWLDHALDVIAAPLAVVAGTLLTAAQLADLDPLAKWALALIAGGGAAGAVQGSTTVLRAVSTAVTGGLANPLVATGEVMASMVTSVGTLFIPVFGLLVLVAMLGLAVVVLLRRRRQSARSLG